jgi:hypothetical protein
VQATPTIKPAAQPQVAKEYIPYEAVLRGEFEEKTAILLPIRRSALPTALVAGQVKGVTNLEKEDEPSYDAVVVQTRTTYRANYKDCPRPSPTHPYVKKAVRWLSKGYGTVWIITEEMYGMEEVKAELDRRGFRAKTALLDVEGARKRLEKIMHPAHAAKLAVSGALIPWLADELGSGGWEGVREKLINLLGKDDGEEVYQTLMEAIKENPEYPNKPLAISLGVLDEGE